MAPNLKDLVAVPHGTIDQRDLLGTITIFTVPDKPVKGSKLTRLWASEGLDPALIPESRQPVHVFQGACREVATKRGGAVGSNGHRTEVKVDEVYENGDECVYQITRLVRDAANQVIDHPKAMTLVFDKALAQAEIDGGKADPITCTPRDPESYGQLKGLEDRVRQDYHRNLSNVPGQKVRNATRDYMTLLGATPMRKSGGVYFVPIAGYQTLQSIERVLDKLYGDDARFDTYPMMSTSSARDKLRDHHAVHVVEDAEALMARIVNRLKDGGTIRKDFSTNILQARRELGARRKQYVELLGTETEKVNDHLEILDEQVEKLMAASVA